MTKSLREMILYATIFVLGMAYVILFQDTLARFFHWKAAWIAFIILWGLFLGVLAWLRGYAHRADDMSPHK